MIAFLSSNIFQCLVLPLVTTLLTIFIRMASRPDSISILDRGTFNVGINLCVTATFILVTKCIILAKGISQKAIPAENGMDILLLFTFECLFMVFGMFGLAYIIRKFGWERNYFANTPQLSIWGGVVIPDLIGILYLVFVFTQKIPNA